MEVKHFRHMEMQGGIARKFWFVDCCGWEHVMKVKAYKAGDKPDGSRDLSGGIKRTTLVSAVLLLISGVAVADPNVSTGKAISGQCAACHGSDGIAVNSQYPDLAGQNYKYLVTQLQRFKSGERNNAIMHGIASGLSKTQIQDLAAYFSSVKRAACRGKH